MTGKELYRAVAEHCARQNVWFMKSRPSINTDAVTYFICGVPVVFSGIEIVGIPSKDAALFVAAKWHTARILSLSAITNPLASHLETLENQA